MVNVLTKNYFAMENPIAKMNPMKMHAVSNIKKKKKINLQLNLIKIKK